MKMIILIWYLFVFSTTCNSSEISQIKEPKFIDLDKNEENQINQRNITYYTLKEREEITPKLLESLFYHNPRTVIYVQDSNTTIVPTDEILETQNLTRLTNLEYIEVKHNFKQTQYNYIPISPCISNNPFKLDPPLMGVAWTHRLALSTRFSGTFGGILSGGYLLNSTTIGLTLGEITRIKFAKERSVDSFAACYSTNREAARLFGYIPMYTTEPITRRISFHNWQNRKSGGKKNSFFDARNSGDFNSRARVELGTMWFPSKPRRLLSDEPVIMVCDVGTRDGLKCNENKGRIVDSYGNEILWESEY
ncbi:hypothetical protein KGF56_003212 [Candida oxycetoniae]|uniref:Uncharacterized protein n=1 Tax=Candida oxycetoniae TaxID=497107 RepID=A0AAI9WXN1_9ASCO|nr:uncharacterized protein KGF56_003212 [Candida oxycetoniae]KAI3403945.2 hypothetical protein KGF56_003212 [Candida oxycetoniae]